MKCGPMPAVPTVAMPSPVQCGPQKNGPMPTSPHMGTRRDPDSHPDRRSRSQRAASRQPPGSGCTGAGFVRLLRILVSRRYIGFGSSTFRPSSRERLKSTSAPTRGERREAARIPSLFGRLTGDGLADGGTIRVEVAAFFRPTGGQGNGSGYGRLQGQAPKIGPSRARSDVNDQTFGRPQGRHQMLESCRKIKWCGRSSTGAGRPWPWGRQRWSSLDQCRRQRCRLS